MKGMVAMMVALARAYAREDRRPAATSSSRSPPTRRTAPPTAPAASSEQHARALRGLHRGHQRVRRLHLPRRRGRPDLPGRRRGEGHGLAQADRHGPGRSRLQGQPRQRGDALAAAVARIYDHEWPVRLTPDGPGRPDRHRRRCTAMRSTRTRPTSTSTPLSTARPGRRAGRRHGAQQRQPDHARRRLQGERHPGPATARVDGRVAARRRGRVRVDAGPAHRRPRLRGSSTTARCRSRPRPTRPRSPRCAPRCRAFDPGAHVVPLHVAAAPTPSSSPGSASPATASRRCKLPRGLRLLGARSTASTSGSPSTALHFGVRVLDHYPARPAGTDRRCPRRLRRLAVPDRRAHSPPARRPARVRSPPIGDEVWWSRAAPGRGRPAAPWSAAAGRPGRDRAARPVEPPHPGASSTAAGPGLVHAPTADRSSSSSTSPTSGSTPSTPRAGRAAPAHPGAGPPRGGLRWADPLVRLDGREVWCVREDFTGDGPPTYAGCWWPCRSTAAPPRTAAPYGTSSPPPPS